MSIYVPDENGELTALETAVVNTTESASQLPPNDLAVTFVKMLLTFVVLVGLLILSYWFLRRLIQNRLTKGVGDQSIQVLEKRMISPKTTLYLIEVENKRILIAESHLEIKRLEGLDPERLE
jgi:flagellar protein FliO/FliZ